MQTYAYTGTGKHDRETGYSEAKRVSDWSVAVIALAASVPLAYLAEKEGRALQVYASAEVDVSPGPKCGPCLRERLMTQLDHTARLSIIQSYMRGARQMPWLIGPPKS